MSQDNPGKRATRSNSTNLTVFQKLDNSNKPIIVQGNLFAESDLEESFDDLNKTLKNTEEQELENQAIGFDDNAFIHELDKKICGNIQISASQTPEERLSAYKKILNNYRVYIIDQKKSDLQSSFQKTEIIEKQNKIIDVLEQRIFELEETINISKTESLPEILVISDSDSENKTVTPDLADTGDSDSVEENMEVKPKDAILAIPVFGGDTKELETFLNTCDLYNQLMAEAQKPNLLLIIKAKIRGEALAKVSPMESLDTWALLKTKLRSVIRKPISYEFAQEDLCNAFQKKDESIEEYAKRFKNKLQKLNEASRALAQTEPEKAILISANEKLAISKFEQNIRDNTVRILVSASSKKSLDETIQIAMHKDMMEKTKNNSKSCSYCGLPNHTEDMCRKKKAANGNNNNNRNQKPSSSFNKQFSKSVSIKEEPKDNGQSSANNQNKQKQNFYKKPNNNANNGNNSNSGQKNVQFIEQPDEITLQEALDFESEASKN